MRWLLRMLLFWAISLPLFYVYGLPLLLERVSAKARSDAYAQCNAHLVKEGMVGQPSSALTAAQAEHYCHCVSDTLTLTKDDLPDVIQKKPPTKLTAQSQELSTKCNAELEQVMRANYAPSPAAVQPVPVQPAANTGMRLIENSN